MPPVPSAAGISSPHYRISTAFFAKSTHEARAELKKITHHKFAQHVHTLPGHKAVEEQADPAGTHRPRGGCRHPLECDGHHGKGGESLEDVRTRDMLKRHVPLWQQQKETWASQILSTEAEHPNWHFKIRLPPWCVALLSVSSASFIPTYLSGWTTWNKLELLLLSLSFLWKRLHILELRY